MRGALRRPPVRRARSVAGACQFFFVSSTSFLHLQAFMPSFCSFHFRFQCFALFLALLEVFFPPPYPPHRPAHSAKPITFNHSFMIFCVFLPSIFLLFFRLVFFAIFRDFEAAWDFQNQAKIGKHLFRKRFFG